LPHKLGIIGKIRTIRRRYGKRCFGQIDNWKPAKRKGLVFSFFEGVGNG
jgi:hypothetical protein